MNATQSSLLARLPGLRHGFTNLRQARAEVDALEARTATVKQVHKAELLWTDHLEKKSREADALATRTPSLAIGVHSADCTPVLAVAQDPATQRIEGLLAIHAGWRGTALQITQRSFTAFAAEFPRARFFAAIGPCISFESFEVGQEVVDAFPGSLPSGLAKPMGAGKYLFDLPGENLRQLRLAAGARPLEVEFLALCTVKLTEQYPSYRRDRANAGRILSFLEFNSESSRASIRAFGGPA